MKEEKPDSKRGKWMIFLRCCEADKKWKLEKCVWKSPQYRMCPRHLKLRGFFWKNYSASSNEASAKKVLALYRYSTSWTFSTWSSYSRSPYVKKTSRKNSQLFHIFIKKWWSCVWTFGKIRGILLLSEWICHLSGYLFSIKKNNRKRDRTVKIIVRRSHLWRKKLQSFLEGRFFPQSVTLYWDCAWSWSRIKQ